VWLINGPYTTRQLTLTLNPSFNPNPNPKTDPTDPNQSTIPNFNLSLFEHINHAICNCKYKVQLIMSNCKEISSFHCFIGANSGWMAGQ